MDDELLKKTKSKKHRTVMIAGVLIILAVLVFAGFSIAGRNAGRGDDAGSSGNSEAKQDQNTGSGESGAGETNGSGENGEAEGSGAGTDVGNAKGSVGVVTVSIECVDLATDMSKLTKPALKKYIPKDGLILDSARYDFQKGDTVYDALEYVCLKNDVQLETSEDAVYKSRYIEGINYLYEKDAGKNSGWLFYVNGKQPKYGASKVKLANKDTIIWHYTVDYESEGDM